LPSAAAAFDVTDIDRFARALGLEAAGDIHTADYWFSVDPEGLATLRSEFGVAFEPEALSPRSYDVSLYRFRKRNTPYLGHTGYELLLLLDGRKKLANMYGEYPPNRFPGEEAFEHWVERGVLHREEVLEPFPQDHPRWKGICTVYYTLKGEEWRIPAMKLIWDASQQSGGWNGYFERLEGMLYGYENWQNDWWIEQGRQRGGFGGSPLICAVSEAGLAWIEQAGFSALPACEESLTIRVFDDQDESGMRAMLDEMPGAAALIRFCLPLWKVRAILPISREAVSSRVAKKDIPTLSPYLRDKVVVAARRGE
jgi:hypothetical protein